MKFKSSGVRKFGSAGVMNNREFKMQLEQRTKQFAISIVLFCIKLKENKFPVELVTQLLKSGTSIGANYREANRAESKKDFIHKTGIVEKESSETVYWLEIFDESNILTDDLSNQLLPLLDESKELLALFTTISKNSKKGRES